MRPSGALALLPDKFLSRKEVPNTVGKRATALSHLDDPKQSP